MTNIKVFWQTTTTASATEKATNWSNNCIFTLQKSQANNVKYHYILVVSDLEGKYFKNSLSDADILEIYTHTVIICYKYEIYLQFHD
jgi:hypothetical protein